MSTTTVIPAPSTPVLAAPALGQSIDQPSAHRPAPDLAMEQQARWAAADEHALNVLVRAFPIGGRLTFIAYGVVTWPRDWRVATAGDPDGLRAGDALETVGYGVGQGFPEALLVRRVRDGTRRLVFPSDVTAVTVPPAPS